MLVMRRSRREAGDTLIEVLFAVSVFSLAVVGSLMLMNQGTATSTRSLQITLVRQQIDNQAETLRFLSAAYVANYYTGYSPDLTDPATSPSEEYFKILKAVKARQAAGQTSVSSFGSGDTTCATAPTSSFVLNSQMATYQAYDASKMLEANTFSQVLYDGGGALTSAQGLWIESVRATPSSGASYVDYHIRACWYPPGTGQPMNLGTIVRLYEPTS